MRNYRQLNKLMSDMREIIRFAYDKGYNQGKTDFKRNDGHWITVTGRNFVQFRCNNCKEMAITDYLFCPFCGSDMRKENDNDT